MLTSKAQQKASIKYAKEKLKRIPLDVQKSKYEEIKAHSEARKESVNGFIKRAIGWRPCSVITPPQSHRTRQRGNRSRSNIEIKNTLHDRERLDNFGAAKYTVNKQGAIR